LQNLINSSRGETADEAAAAAGECHCLYRRRAQRKPVDGGIGAGQVAASAGLYPCTIACRIADLKSQGKRHDIIQLGGENLATGLNGEGLFLFAGDQKDVDAIYANPLLAHLPAVQNKRVWALGTETFRLDYYSAMRVLERRLNTGIPTSH
jgi:ABC-type Fe2+-enterobactin transport system substrate-binding protein